MAITDDQIQWLRECIYDSKAKASMITNNQLRIDIMPPKCMTEPEWDELKLNTSLKSNANNNGGSTDYYKLPNEAIDLADLIEYKNMSFNVGNIFKACFRLGDKEGVDDEYDLNKIIYFANRELARIVRTKTKSQQ